MNLERSNAERLEELWAGDFGDAYVERNANAVNGRQAFWDELLDGYRITTVLEVGCNVGGNLHWLAKRLGARNVYGVDINEEALANLRRHCPGVNAIWSPARTLPFRDGRFDLTFTTGVLIHQAPEALPLVMSELVRCSRRFVLCGEYHAEELTEVPYRGQSGALWKRDWGKLYVDLFPELRLRATGFLPRGPGSSWDDVTWWLFEKPGFD